MAKRNVLKVGMHNIPHLSICIRECLLDSIGGMIIQWEEIGDLSGWSGKF